MAAAEAERVGARYVILTDVNPFRLDLARSLGIEHTVNTSEARLEDVMSELHMLEGFDVGLEMSGSQP